MPLGRHSKRLSQIGNQGGMARHDLTPPAQFESKPVRLLGEDPSCRYCQPKLVLSLVLARTVDILHYLPVNV